MKYRKLKQRIWAISLASMSSILMVTACGSSGSDVSSSKRDKYGNPLAYGVQTPGGQTPTDTMADFINKISKKGNTQTENFIAYQSALYQYLYEGEYNASLDAAKKYSNDSIKIDSYDKQLQNAQNALDDEKKDYQKTYRDKWQQYWQNHIITTYNAANDAQAVKNKTASQIKTTALNRYTLKITGDKAPDNPYIYSDIRNPEYEYLKNYKNVYYAGIDDPSASVSDGTKMFVLQTKSLDTKYDDPEQILKDYWNTTADGGYNNRPLFLAHFLTGIKPGTDSTSDWTITTDTLNKLFSRPLKDSTKTVLQLLQERGMDMYQDGSYDISGLNQRQEILNLFSDGTATNNGSEGNYKYTDLNQTLKSEVGMGIAYAEAIGTSAVTKLSAIKSFDADNTNTGFFSILEHAVLNEIGETDPNKITSATISQIGSSGLSAIGNVLSHAFDNDPTASTASLIGRQLAYISDDLSSLVLISPDGIDFTSIDKLNFNDLPSDTSKYKSFFNNPSEMWARIRYDLKESSQASSLYFDIPTLISTAMSSGNMQNYALKKAITDTSFLDFLKNKYPDLVNETQNVANILAEENVTSNIPKNGVIYKWVRDFYDTNSSNINPSKRLISLTINQINTIYTFIKNSEA